MKRPRSSAFSTKLLYTIYVCTLIDILSTLCQTEGFTSNIHPQVIEKRTKSTIRIYSSASSIDEGSNVDLKYIEFTDNAIDGGEPVLLLHGLLGQKRNFASLGTALASQLEKKRKIFAVDLRNHGDNTHDWRDEMSYSHHAKDILAFLNKHEIDKAVLIGHSMGGKVSQSLALSNPERVAGLVVLDIAPIKYTADDPSWSAVRGIIESLRELELTPGKTKREVDMDLRKSVEDPALRAFVLTNIETIPSKEKVQSLRWKINVDAIANELHKIAGFDVNSIDLDEEIVDLQYVGDTFFIKGGASSFVKGSHMSVISKHFPNYMVTTVKGAGHWVHAESPEATVALLKRYLDR